MPAVVAGALVSAIGLTGVAGTVATALIGAGASFALNSLTAKPAGARTTSLSAGTRFELVRDATLARRVIYGRARVSGPIAFAHTANGDAGQVNAFLHLVIPLAMHEVTSIGACQINDEVVVPRAGAQGWWVPTTASRYCYKKNPAHDGATTKHYLQWRTALGTPGQAADPFLMKAAPNLWTYRHCLSGMAYAYLHLVWESNVWAGGLPNISFTVEGKKLFDPRTGITAFSNNPALVIRDYLLAEWGLNCRADEIDEASFIAAAHLCDEMVPTSNGTEQRRYICDGVISTDEKPIEVMERLLSSCGGALVYAQGTYKLYPAAYRPPVLTLHEGMLRGPARIRPIAPRASRVNTLRGSFIDPARGWLLSDFAPVTNSAYRAADGNEWVKDDVRLDFTTDATTAQRLARLQLERSRHQLTVELPLTLAGLNVAVMEPVRLNMPSLGWVDKVFVPVEWTLSEEGGVDVVLLEDDPAFYAWDGGSPTNEAPAVELPDIYPLPPLLTVRDGVVSSAGLNSIALLISTGADRDAFVARYEVEYRLQSASEWQSAGGGNQLTVTGVEVGAVYAVRARAINQLNIASDWAETTYQVMGNAQPPANVTGLNGIRVDDNLTLEWAGDASLVGHYRLRWSPVTVGGAWASAVDIATVSSPRLTLPARQGSYYVKAVDTQGRESALAAEWVNSAPSIGGFNTVGTLTEHPAFAGSKTNTIVNGSGQLQIDSLLAFDAQNGLFEALAGNFDGAGGGASSEGVYEFATPLDLQQVYGVRLSARIKTSVIDLVSSFEEASGLFDAREGDVDGTAPSAVDVLLEVATTTGDPAGSPSWSAWQKLSVGDYTARGFKFRARLTTANPMATPAVEELAVLAEMPDRVATGSDVVSAASGTTLTFSPAFKATPAISITPQNMATGDYWTLTTKSRTGFTVRFFNSSGTGISRTFDWSARGYGLQQ